MLHSACSAGRRLTPRVAMAMAIAVVVMGAGVGGTRPAAAAAERTGSPAGHATTAPDPARASRAAPFAYTAGTHRYRLVTVVKRTQNQAGGRAPFEFSQTTTMDVTVTLARRARDTMSIAVAIDTVYVTATLDAPPPSVAGIQGAKLTGLISPQGRVYAFAPPPGTPPGVETALYRAFRRFLVPFPSADVHPGTAWVDSTRDTVTKSGFNTTTLTVSTSRVTGDTTYAGQPAWRVERSATLATTGTATDATHHVELSADGTIRGVAYVGTSGVFLGESTNQTHQMRMAVPDSGIESMPIQQTIQSTVSPLPAARTAAR